MRGFCKSHAEFPHEDDFLSNRYWIHSRSGTTIKTAAKGQKKQPEQWLKSSPSEHLWRLIREEFQPKKRETERKYLSEVEKTFQSAGKESQSATGLEMEVKTTGHEWTVQSCH